MHIDNESICHNEVSRTGLDEQAASLASRHHAAPDDTRPVQAQPLVRFHARHCCKKLVGYRAGVLILVDVGGRLKG